MPFCSHTTSAAPGVMSHLSARDFTLGAAVSFEALADNPYPIFHRLRTAEPVTWAPQLGMWLLTRRDDVLRVLADWQRFTTDSPASTIRDIFGSHMLTTDGDKQVEYKRRFIDPFRRGRLEQQLRTSVEDVVRRLLDRIEERGASAQAGDRAADLRAQLARPLSWRSICGVLGLPEADGDRFLAWYDAFAAALANFEGDPATRHAGKTAAEEFRCYVAPFLRGEREAPSGSTIAALRSVPNSLSEPNPLSEAEAVANLLIVLFGGIETTESMIANAFWAVLSHADAARTAATDPAMLPVLIEESMRWEPAVQSCTRFTTETVELGGAAIPAGETVQCMLGAANRDPAHFPDPDRFDPSRPNVRDHLAFGAGRHFCLGASLARIEAHQALAQTFVRFPAVRLDPERPTRPRGHEFRAPPAVWVRW